MSFQLRVLVSTLAFLLTTHFAYAAGAKRPRTKARTVKPRTVTNPEMQAVSSSGYPLSSRIDRAPVLPAAPAIALKPPAASLTVAENTAPDRLINIRLHPTNLFSMLTQKDTLASFRADVDLIAGKRFTIGPSISYLRSSTVDNTALAGGNFQTMELTRWDLGVLSNIYLFGTTSQGGLILRPHVYYVAVEGEKQNEQDATVANGTATNGWRTGAEVVYQHILPIGFNFEVGGGFTYHVSPYEVSYGGDNAAKSAPDHTVEPIVTVGIGWAF